MPMDALCLSAILTEADSAVTGGRIDKIHQPSRDEILLHIRARGATAVSFSPPTPPGPASSSPGWPGRTLLSPRCFACCCGNTFPAAKF